MVVVSPRGDVVSLHVHEDLGSIPVIKEAHPKGSTFTAGLRHRNQQVANWKDVEAEERFSGRVASHESRPITKSIG